MNDNNCDNNILKLNVHYEKKKYVLDFKQILTNKQLVDAIERDRTIGRGVVLPKDGRINLYIYSKQERMSGDLRQLNLKLLQLNSQLKSIDGAEFQRILNKITDVRKEIMKFWPIDISNQCELKNKDNIYIEIVDDAEETKRKLQKLREDEKIEELINDIVILENEKVYIYHEDEPYCTEPCMIFPEGVQKKAIRKCLHLESFSLKVRNDKTNTVVEAPYPSGNYTLLLSEPYPPKHLLDGNCIIQ